MTQQAGNSGVSNSAKMLAAMAGTSGTNIPAPTTKTTAAPTIASAATPAAAAPAATPTQQAVQNFVATGGGTPKPKPVAAPGTPTAPTSLTPIVPEDDNHAVATDADIEVAGAKIFNKISVKAGLGLAFGILIFLIWTLIPTASGYTRLQLLWFTLIGQTRLATSGSPTPGPQGPVVADTPLPPSSPSNPSTPQAPVLLADTLAQGSGPGSNGHLINFPDLSVLDHVIGDF